MIQLFFALALVQGVEVSKEVPRAVTSPAPWYEVISASEMRSLGEFFSPELLSFVPGAWSISGVGRPGNDFTLFMRALPPYGTPVYVEGVPLISVIKRGQFNLGVFPPFFIDQMEVFVGPAAAVFGARASSGGINIYVPSQAKGLSADILMVERGNWFFNAGAGLSLMKEKLMFNLRGGGDFSPYNRPGMNEKRGFVAFNCEANLNRFKVLIKSFYLKRKADLGFKFSFSLTMDALFRSLYQGPVKIAVIDPNDTVEEEVLFLISGFNRHMGSFGNAGLRFYVERVSEALHQIPDQLDSSTAIGGDYVIQEASSWLMGARLFWNGRHRLLSWDVEGGVEESLISYFSFSPLPVFAASSGSFDRSRLRAWIRVMNVFSVGFLSLTTAVRGEVYEDYGDISAVSIRATATLPPFVEGLRWSISGSISRGVRVPFLQELYFSTMSNPELRPEKTFMTDVTLLIETVVPPAGKVGLTISYFKNRLRDAISVVQGEDFVLRLENLSVFYSEGLEVSLKGHFFSTLSLKLAYTLMGGRSTTEDLKNFTFILPEHRLSAAVSFSLPVGTVVAEIYHLSHWKEPGSYVDEMGNLHGTPDGMPFEEEGFTLLNFYWRKIIMKSNQGQLEVGAKLYNVLNSSYRLPGGGPGVPRTLMAHLSFRM